MPTCECWNRSILEDHRLLNCQKEALKSFLEHPEGPRDRRVHVSKILDSLDPCLRLHLQKEEQVLFPAFARLPGAPLAASRVLRTQHDDLRVLLDRLAGFLADRENFSWDEIAAAGEALAALLEDHEEREGRFLSDFFEFHLQPEQLSELARRYKEASLCACGEGDRTSRWRLGKGAH